MKKKIPIKAINSGRKKKSVICNVSLSNNQTIINYNNWNVETTNIPTVTPLDSYLPFPLLFSTPVRPDAPHHR